MIRVAPCLALVAVVAACEPPVRYSLAVPFSPIMGATPISSEGLAIGAEGGDGLRGQDVQRAEMSGVVLVGGIENRIGAALSDHQTTDNPVHTTSLRLKVRVARPLVPNSALAVHVGTFWSHRLSGGLQDDGLTGFDFALPIEVLATRSDAKFRLSGFVAPRIVTERYEDRLTPSQTLNTGFAGLSSGLHLRAWFLDVYAETTVANVPKTMYQGVQYGGRVSVFPMAALTARFGQPYRWTGK